MKDGALDILIVSQVTKVPPEEIERQIDRYNEIADALPELEKEHTKATEKLDKIKTPLLQAEQDFAILKSEHDQLSGKVNQMKLEEEKLTKLLGYFTEELDKLKETTRRKKESIDEALEKLNKDTLLRASELDEREKEIQTTRAGITAWAEDEEQRIATLKADAIEEQSKLKQKEERLEKMLHEQLRLKHENDEKLSLIEEKEKSLTEFEERLSALYKK